MLLVAEIRIVDINHHTRALRVAVEIRNPLCSFT